MLNAAARTAGLDLNRWEQDRHSAAVRLKVERDIIQGIHLEIEGTPAVFLDGRRVKNPNVIVLETLIREELKDARRALGALRRSDPL